MEARFYIAVMQFPAGSSHKRAQAQCTDPTNLLNNDIANAWRSTETIPASGQTITFPVGADGGPAITRTLGQTTVYLNRFGQAIANQQDYTDTYADQSTFSSTAMTATESSRGKCRYDPGQ